MAACPLCGLEGAVCGPHGLSHPVELITAARVKGTAMASKPAPLAEYTVVINGVETTAQLTEAHARRLGARPVAAGTATATGGSETPTKRRRPANKSA